MKCIIIEDQPPAQRILKKYISDLGNLELLATFSDAISAMDFLRNKQVDLIFLDIHLPKMSGIDFLKTVPDSPNVILTTAFSDYALESYEFNVCDYLLKPFSFQRFVKAVSKAQNSIKSGDIKQQAVPSDYLSELFIKVGHELIKINIENILFIKSDTDYTEIYTSGKKYLSSEPLRHWENTLNPKQFVRVHKSYIINVSKIEKLSGNQLYLNNKVIVPIGRVFKENLMEKIQKEN